MGLELVPAARAAPDLERYGSLAEELAGFLRDRDEPFVPVNVTPEFVAKLGRLQRLLNRRVSETCGGFPCGAPRLYRPEAEAA
jgi:hypothetical protein